MRDGALGFVAVGDRPARALGGRRHRARRGGDLSRRRRPDRRVEHLAAAAGAVPGRLQRLLRAGALLRLRRRVPDRLLLLRAVRAPVHHRSRQRDAGAGAARRDRQRAGQRRGAVPRPGDARPCCCCRPTTTRSSSPSTTPLCSSASPDVSYTLLRLTGHKSFEHPASHAIATLRVADWIADRF